ncbi:MAG: phosphotyrosine protein phosphatase [Nanoarchaeota archaeon]
MNLLFVCNQNENRSKTAEELFKDRENVRSAGLFNKKPLTREQLSWADLVLVMEDRQRAEIGKRFQEYLQKRILSLDIPDVFAHNQPELKALIKEKVSVLLKP